MKEPRTSIIVVDNFYEDPLAVVDHAKRLQFLTTFAEGTTESSKRKIWETSRWQPAKNCPFKSSTSLIQNLELIVGARIDIDYWNADYPTDSEGQSLVPFHKKVSPDLAEKYQTSGAFWNASFHCKYFGNQALGEGVHNHTLVDHVNGVGEQNWVGLVYLNPKESRLRNGLNTWRNVKPDRQLEWMSPKENWILIDSFGMVFNRLILHRGDIPHSGGDGWGNSVLDCRLFQTFFFRTVDSANKKGIAPLKIDLTSSGAK